MNGDQALFEGQIDGLVAQSFENERPLRGLAGLLDWRLKGALSGFIRVGTLTGKEGELCYLPVQHHDRLIHCFFLGRGINPMPGQRTPPGKDLLRALQNQLQKLKFTRNIGFSISDLGKINRDYFDKEWKGPPPCLLP